ncbi:hypothetical protein M8997_018690 [Phyllobacterium sp. 21LDTY02-6]|uniref:DUF4190 domain-containing protein n=1 Tax=Phyllobacterium sp. 21LDTY02-6 TaxID=2944903 RepID=UPI0020208A69|nr:hypothetical protein [Phyllobacterium sp. 21LDTY02-6]MCO4319217.1 hypothetical protein [Phyllobacterium sp. 21LDTY02-6]
MAVQGIASKTSDKSTENPAHEFDKAVARATNKAAPTETKQPLLFAVDGKPHVQILKEKSDGPAGADDFRSKAKENKWTVVEEKDALPPVSNLKPKRVDPTTITYDYEGKTYAVSEHLTPFKFSVLENKLAGTEISKTDNNIDIKVADSEATDFMNAKTTEDGKTVGELFHDNMKKEWGELDIKDPRRQYYELLQAKAALVGGYEYLPSETGERIFGTTGTSYLPNTVIMDQASTYGLLKEEEVSKKLAELSQNEEVIDGVDGLMKDAVAKIEDKKGLVNNIYKTMGSQEYMDMLEGMDSDGAKTRFANDLKSLDYLDKEKATEIRSKILDKGLVDEISKIVESGEYSDEGLKTAVNDQVQMGLQGTFSTIFGIAFSDKAVQNYLKDGKADLPDDVKRGLDSYKAAVKIASNSIVDSFKSKGSFDIKDVSSRISTVLKANNPDIPTGVRNGAAALLQASMKNGVLPAIGGVLSATAAIYTLNKNMGDTVEERMGAARGLLIAVATTPALALASTKALGKMFDNPGMATMLGLENNTQLREIYLERFPNADNDITIPGPRDIELDTIDEQRSAISGLLPEPDLGEPMDDWARHFQDYFSDVASGEGETGGRPATVSADSLDDIMEDPNSRVATATSESGSRYSNILDDLDADRRASIMGMVDDRIGNMGLDPSDLDNPSKLRLVGTVLGTVGGMADFTGGVLDLALGGMSIDKLRNNPDALPSEYAAATMQLLGGISIAGMAGTSLASMIAGPATASALGIASGVLGIAGVGFGAIAAIVTGVIAKQKQERKADELRQDFNDWSTLGVTEDDWGDKLNYTSHARYNYNYYHGTNRYYDLYPEDKPVWEARPDQYKDFTNYVDDHGRITEDWFDDWDKDHNSGLGEGSPDPSGLPRFGDDGKPGTFDDFKQDIDRVDVGSIEQAEDGRVIFTKDGVKQVIDPIIGGEADEKDRQKIIDYLNDLYEISHPDGKRDQEIIDRITRLHDESDRHNDIDYLKRALDTSKAPLLGREGKAGTFSDFKEDIDRVDIGSIELDPTNSNSISFVKDGRRWALDKNDHGDLSDSDASDIFDYLKDLHIMVQKDGGQDQELIDKITELHDKSDDHNDLDDLRTELGLASDPSGLPLFGDGGIPGTFSDFKEDVDRVDVGSIELLDDGRVIFTKDGVKQIINSSAGDDSDRDTRDSIIGYLSGLYELTHPDGKFSKEIADKMNEIFGGTDKYNDLDDIREHLEA